MSKIEWTEKTWNPLTGCDRISPECDRCYALTLAGRLKRMGAAAYQQDGDPRTSGPGFGLTLHPEKLTEPLRWHQPRQVFVNSMSDLFHGRVPVAFIREVFATMTLADWHTFQVLTKRAHRLRMLAPQFPWPAHVWMGVSVGLARFYGRIHDLVQTPAQVKFLSLEPLLGPLAALPLAGIDWCIVGGESGSGARPMHPDWVRDIRDQCQAAGVAFFFKQWGGVQKHRTGRLLDGRTWDAMPPAPTPTPEALGQLALFA